MRFSAVFTSGVGIFENNVWGWLCSLFHIYVAKTWAVFYVYDRTLLSTYCLDKGKYFDESSFCLEILIQTNQPAAIASLILTVTSLRVSNGFILRVLLPLGNLSGQLWCKSDYYSQSYAVWSNERKKLDQWSIFPFFPFILRFWDLFPFFPYLTFWEVFPFPPVFLSHCSRGVKNRPISI